MLAGCLHGRLFVLVFLGIDLLVVFRSLDTIPCGVHGLIFGAEPRQFLFGAFGHGLPVRFHKPLFEIHVHLLPCKNECCRNFQTCIRVNPNWSYRYLTQNRRSDVIERAFMHLPVGHDPLPWFHEAGGHGVGTDGELPLAALLQLAGDNIRGFVFSAHRAVYAKRVAVANYRYIPYLGIDSVFVVHQERNGVGDFQTGKVYNHGRIPPKLFG